MGLCGQLCGLLAVTAPRYVVIQNWRLGALLLGLRVAVIAYIAWHLFTTRPWKTLTDVDVTNTWWFESGDYFKTLRKDLASPLGQAGESYDYAYKYDASGDYDY